MKVSLLASLLALALPVFAADSDPGGWQTLFDGKSLDGWQASEKPGTFSVENGELIVHGQRSHLFYVGPVHNHDWTNFEIKADIMAKHGANSGVYFHTEFQQEGWPEKGYEVQVNNTHADPKKTAGLYAVKDNFDKVADDDVWFTMSIKVEGKHVVTKVNDKVVTDYTEEQPPQRTPDHQLRFLSHGTFALQGHDPGSEVHYKNIMVRALP
jgi:hypothetical protein